LSLFVHVLLQDPLTGEDDEALTGAVGAVAAAFECARFEMPTMKSKDVQANAK
jgi:hypothetical protein